MKKNSDRAAASVLGFAFSLLAVICIPKEGIRRIIEFIRYRGFGARQMEFIFRAWTIELVEAIALIIAVIVLLNSLITIFRTAGRPRTPGLNQPREKVKTETDSTMRYVSKNDKERYIAQLDSYLQNGLVTREEYQVLKERYEKRR